MQQCRINYKNTDIPPRKLYDLKCTIYTQYLIDLIQLRLIILGKLVTQLHCISLILLHISNFIIRNEV